ncbi:MAG: NAD(P)-binding domain-containing protein [Planctomycetota bacterium]
MSEALILGSGPAGLAAAVCLRRHGIPATVLEAGPRPSHGWKLLDPEVRLLTPQALSRLPGMEFAPDLPTYLSLGSYAHELDRYRERHGVAVACGARAIAVRPRYGRFEVDVLEAGVVHTRSARWVIDASGNTTHPVLPADAPARPPWPALHARDVRPDDLAQARRLLVVGSGTSARETVETYRRVAPSSAELVLAARSAPNAVPRSVLGVDSHYWVWALEFWPGHWPGPHHGWTRDPALGQGLARALRSGAIRNLGAIERWEPTVVGEHGSFAPDLVVYATGYRHPAAHLGDLVRRTHRDEPALVRAAAPGVPGLYALGVHYGRSLASSFLRGIARDARAVARRIAREAGR